MSWFERLSPMIGRLALVSEAEADLLARYVAHDGDHVEIGCLWGGTALLAGLAKRDAGKLGQVITIDPMRGGWWDSEDPMVKRRPTFDAVCENIDYFGLAESVVIVRKPSDPWPLPKKYKPASVLIDGDHCAEAVAKDWLNASRCASDCVLFHDYASPKHPGVQSVVDNVARANPRWREIDRAGSLIVFGRKRGVK